jgi:hypothetical protein
MFARAVCVTPLYPRLISATVSRNSIHCFVRIYQSRERSCRILLARFLNPPSPEYACSQHSPTIHAFNLNTTIQFRVKTQFSPSLV